MPNLDTFISSRDQAILDFREQQSRDAREREAAEDAKRNLDECLELAEALTDDAAAAVDQVCANAARIGCLTAFIAVWATRVPEIRADLEKQTSKL